MRRLQRLVAQTCAGETQLTAERLSNYPLDGPLPESENTGRKLPDGSPRRTTYGLDTTPEAPTIEEVEEARKTYEEFRRVRVEGVKRGWSEYQRVSDLAKTDARFAHMYSDPFTNSAGMTHMGMTYPATRGGRPPRPVGKVQDEITYTVVGGGLSGVSAAGRLREQGIPASEIRIVEFGADVGGTWYWNRYPGAMCDVESHVYMPFCEELTCVPTEKYARQPEIYGHMVRVMEHYGLYEKSLFSTKVQDLRWDDVAWNWKVITEQGDEFRSRFIIINFGIFSQPKLPSAPPGKEIQNFGGHIIHTARWDFEYTGGTSLGGMTKLSDKRVAIIGTGPTAIQAVPHLGNHAKHLYVMQRTPGTVNVRNNFPTPPDFVKAQLAKPGWQLERIRNFSYRTETPAAMIRPDAPNLVDDGWTGYPFLPSIAGEMVYGGKDKADILDLAHMKEIRNRVGTIVQDPKTAEDLKPYYKYGCKRPGFHDEYLYTFNKPHVTLVSCPKGIQGFTKTGILANDQEHGPIDLIVLATGFEIALTLSGGGDQMKKRVMANDFEVYGTGGVSLTDAWADGPRTLNSLNARGFPNMFIMLGPQGALGVNNNQAMTDNSTHIAHVLGKLRKEGIVYIEPTAEATQAYCDKILKSSGRTATIFPGCPPGWLGNEGNVTTGQTLASGFPGGSAAFVKMLEKRRAQGSELEGMDVRKSR